MMNPIVTVVLLALVAYATADDAGVYVLDSGNLGRRFDGHGGLSAGASSRLLYDYSEPYRSDVLDYLWKPNFGAALAICKVEIGGDVQSTDGTEASHMHTKTDLNFNRGYEYWLMAEAKKRNPQVKTYALSWGTPAWVGATEGTYFSDDNIDYQTKFLIGARDVYNITIDYLGIWNERPWGNPNYVKKLRNSLDQNGFNSTILVGADGGIPQDQINALKADPEFSAIEPILGRHYPCHGAEPSDFWALQPPKTFWANEDFSTIGGDWAGASCWGRSLLQNYVLLNATATITWATLWSVYDSWRYFGNGLMYAYQPWSGNYTVPPTIWTSAHVNQFAEPGWVYLGGQGVGMLPGGGSWTAMIPPANNNNNNNNDNNDNNENNNNGPRTVANANANDFTLVVEKLEGRCLRCSVAATTGELVQFKLSGAIASATTLKVWMTNSTVQFVQLADIDVQGGSFSLYVPRDHIFTITTTVGQAKGEAAAPIPPYKPFPMPYSESYDNLETAKPAMYHADNGGSFEVFQPKSEDSNKVLLQASPQMATVTAWAGNYDPITTLGSADWVNYYVNVSVLIQAPSPYAEDFETPFKSSADPVAQGPYGGVCVRQVDQFDSGFCLLVGQGLSNGKQFMSGPSWVLQGGSIGLALTAGTILASGTLASSFNVSEYHRLALDARGATLTAYLDGGLLGRAVNTDTKIPPVGLAGLRSGYHFAYFDDLEIGTTAPSYSMQSLFNKHLLWPPAAPPGGGINAAPARNNWEGWVGCSFKVGDKPLVVESLGRLAAGVVSSEKHTLQIVDAVTDSVVASSTVDMSSSAAADLNGFVWADLAQPVTLDAGREYYLVSEEQSGGDYFYDLNVQVQSLDNALAGYAQPIYAGPDRVWQTNSLWGTLTTALTGQCMDRAGTPDAPGTRIDTWDCVSDHHNEMFQFADGFLYVRSVSSTPNLCVSSGPCSTYAPESFCQKKCDVADTTQRWDLVGNNSIRPANNHSLCVQAAAAPAEDAALTLTPCATPLTPAQTWKYQMIDDTVAEWGQCFGPLNVRLRL